jgi:glycosyltransferase involved in cell wall biosynthesis
MLNDKTVCFTLLTRNCKNELAQNLNRIQNIKKYFKQVKVVIIENDSTDGTKEFLHEYQLKIDNVFVIFSKNNSMTDRPGSIDRNNRMAFYRNEYLRFISRCDWRSELDYLIVLDSDIKGFSEKGVVKAIENAPEDWGALFANGRYFFDFCGMRFLGKYYDLFAFIPLRKYMAEKNTIELSYREMALYSDLLSNNNLRKYRYFGCQSAFGGIGIYKYQIIKNSNYRTQKNSRSKIFEALCEHISFNTSYIGSGMNYISSEMMVYYEKRLKSVFSKFISSRLKIAIYECLTHKKFPE